MATLDKLPTSEKADGIAELRTETASLLHSIVAGMNVNNFVVRPQRRMVEQYADAKAWELLTIEQQAELENVAGLPSELADEDQDAKQFDLLMLRLQLALMSADKSFQRMRQQVRDMASDLAEMKSIPMVAQHMALILEVQTDEFWQDVTSPILENVRKKLRALIKLIERKKRNQVYTDFVDELGAETEIQFKGISTACDYARFKAKALQFLKAHENDTVIHKLRWNEPLTPTDLAQLEKMLVEAGTGTSEDVELAKKESFGLGLFVRSLVGLDRDAAKQVFGCFLQDKALDANQIDFINLIVDHLTQRGWMDTSALYESPFVDYSSKGVDGLFNSTQVDKLVSILDDVRQRAAA